ncbi:MAG: short-chain dehydrogenase [Candidatus Lloydbacteria bacterium CG22_combo_CG10-13_8_21_14_all_47_15]|uniref:Short-chain dehydrogenase n=1 Tax=Candidatus Lloydbacteria bacterium CG22_combo_CG10-13_8_21_14_all_47_15 TaxID=1974635 RepID=A0A2H0CV80_9BACT|nr:MAG: short-chain dehydrogenase [Candidatus Lloydbacteria bacterium CG22_combo_CG10-13_8_21_14_all_47_15]
MNKEKIFELFSLEGKVAIITGGNGMLGREYAGILEKAGATVICFDVAGNNPVDITDQASVHDAVEGVIYRYEHIDILINNAATTDFSMESEKLYHPFEEFPFSLWEKELHVSLDGAFISTQTVVPHMKKAMSGTIVNISSTHGIVAPDNRIYDEGKYKSLAYPTVKSGILGFTRGLASQLAPYGIRVNALSPGGVEAAYMDKTFVTKYSKQTMLGRMARKDEYNGAILFLCSDASSYITGATLIADGGLTAW